MKQLLLFALLCGCLNSFKILMTVPKFGFSHVQTMGKLADILVAGGHDVTLLLPVVFNFPSNGTELAKVILVEPPAEIKQIAENPSGNDAIANLWKHSANSKAGIMWSVDLIGGTSYFLTKSILKNTELIESLKNEKFDIGITELFDFTGMAFFDAIGLKNVVGAHTTSVFEGTLFATGAPYLPSFVPASQSFTDDSGSLMSRLNNLYMGYYSYRFQNDILNFAQKAMDEHYGKGKSTKIWDMVKNITWFLVNSDPIFDFPKPLPHNVIEIAGISVPTVNPVNENFNAILNKNKINVLVSFGSIASPTTMPEVVKKSLVDTFAAFPDVTFIWKYDDTESKLADHLNNVEIVKWMPQNDLLADKRVSLFITHGGMASLVESSMKGVPLVVVPIFGDQMRNAQIAKRHGSAVIYDKMELSNSKKLIAAIHEVLDNKKYKESAELLAKILATDRVSPRQKVLDAIEFAGRFGPMPRWTSSSKEFSLIKYFNLDIAAIFAFILLTLILIVSFTIRHVYCSIFSAEKEKNE